MNKKKEYQSRWYEKHRKEHIERTARRRIIYKSESRRYVFEYLSSHPCEDCGETDVVVLEFDHKDPKSKKKEVAGLITSGYPPHFIKKEIDKCRVLCANCHRKKTAIKQGWYKQMIQSP